MAGEKNKAVVVVINGLTPTQAANIQAVIIKAKDKHAPKSKGTIVVGNKEDVGNMLQQGQKSVGLLGNKEVKTVEKKKQ